MQLTHLASSLNFPCAFSMALYQTKKSLQIISEYLPHPIFTLMLESERFSKLCCPQRLFSSFFSGVSWEHSGLPWPEVHSRGIENLRVLKPSSNHIHFHQQHGVPTACVTSLFGSSQQIISHLPVASVFVFPTPAYFYFIGVMTTCHVRSNSD